MNAPLTGYRVLDMSRILAGPWATQVLADLGAEVIKVERPGVGDDTRHWGPPYLKDAQGKETSESAYFMSVNRGKKSIAIDIRHPQGQALIHKLAAASDVFLENFKVGTLKKYHLDYDTLKLVNPKLVYCSITGFGQYGPYANRPGYDFLIQGMGGLMSITGEPDESPGGMPTKVGVAVTDIIAGLYAAIGIQAALLERETSGAGKHIDLALFDTCAAILANQATNYLIGGQVPERMGNAHPNIVPYQTFAACDNHIIIAVGNDNQFRSLCHVVGMPSLADDAKYATNQERVRNRKQLCLKLAAIIAQKSSEFWLDALEKAGVPCGPINTIDKVFESPQIKARNMLVSVEHPLAGKVLLPANPIKFSGTEERVPAAPPVLGESTKDVLKSVAGYSQAKIDQLIKDGVVMD
ncbi:acetyl-CoA:oxalate CoA-transferase [bacterium MnTg04]|nr:acetyl-CoA:oxalate CoA-transferase [bacterium MnTg04]